MPRFSSRSSSVSAYDDIDAITPCPLPAPTPKTATPSSKTPASLSTSSSYTTTTTNHHSDVEAEDMARQSRRSSNSSSHHHRRILGMAITHGSTRSPSPTNSLALSETACEEDLDTFVSRRRDSIRALEQGAGGDPERLWRRMLELQQAYGCYNSARMSAALESGDASLLLRPSKACLNLLNENMILLPDDADYMLRDHNTPATSSGHSTSH
ncbi:uncharacterized protein PG998_008991 [Apiospora kogelbergensis]|uniref:uncharacterized protein n=1 Tax=Apiospora kogelbergensis TaxID=1337665 RepID=UPI0031318E6D